MKKQLLIMLVLLFVTLNGWAQTTREVPGTYATIQAAIDSAIAGDIINVAAGTYNENLTITKAVNLIGADKATTIIKGVSANGRVLSVNNVTTAMTISGFTFDAENCAATKRGIQVATSTHITVENNIIIYYSDMGIWTLSNNIIRNNTITCAGTDTYGSIYISGTENIIDHNIITGFTTDGIYINGGSIPINQNNIIKRNTLIDNITSGSSRGIELYNSGGNIIGGTSPTDGNIINLKTPSFASGVKILTNPDGYVTSNTIQNNKFDGGNRILEVAGFVGGTTTFSDNIIGETTPPSAYGVMLYGGSAVISGNTFHNVPGPIQFGRAGGVAAMNVTINNNIFDGGGSNVAAIYGYNYQSATVHQNKFNLDAGAKAINAQAATIDAISNWWGAASGPYHATTNTCGTGFIVTDNVTFIPWFIDTAMTGTANGNLPVHNATQNTYYCTIQSAIDAATAGDVINVVAGTYYEEVLISGKTNLTLTGAGEGLTIVAPARSFALNNNGISLYNSNNITIQNLTIDGFANAGLAAGVAHFKDGIHFGNNASPELTAGGNNCIFTHVTIQNIDRRGISTFPETISNNEVTYCIINNVTGVNNGEGYGHAIKFNGSGKIEHCTISNVTGAILGNCNVVGGTLSIQDNVITALTGLTTSPFDIGINFWCKQSNVITVKNNSITANVDDNTGIYVVRGGDGSEISYNTLNLTGNGGLGIETGWENTWGFAVHHNTITMGKGGAGIVITGAGSDADPMLIYNNTLTNIGSNDLFVNDYTGYSEREVGLLLSGHQYTSRTGDANYSFNGSVYNNTINGFKDGIVLASQVYASGGFKDVEIKLSDKNNITNYETAARYGYISNTSPYPFTEIASNDANYSQQDLSMNYWGSSAPDFSTIIDGKINYCPYYKDAGFTIFPVKNVNTGVGYCAIQVAITAATAGDVIDVAAGIYTENLSITKPLSIIGASRDNVIINAQLTSPQGGTGIAILNTNNVIIKNITIKDAKSLASTNWDDNEAQGILISNSDNCLIDNVKLLNNGWYEIFLWNGSDHNTITNCVIDGKSSSSFSTLDGIFSSGGPIIESGSNSINTYNTFSNNSISNVVFGISLAGSSNTTVSGNIINPVFDITGGGYFGYGINIFHSQNNSISRNVIDGNNHDAFYTNAIIGIRLRNANGDYPDGDNLSYAGNTSGNNIDGNTIKNFINGTDGQGIKIQTYNISNPLVVSNNTFTNNIIKDNYTGIQFWDNVLFTGNEFSNNSITGNTSIGFENQGSLTINASNNYWGDATGPHHTILNSAGLGNSVANNVSFIPWWCDAAMTSKCAPAGAIVNTTTGEVYGSAELGTALGAADDGQTLYVAPGTISGTIYNDVTPGKTVYISGSGIPGQSQLSGASPALTVTAGNIVIKDGIEFIQNTDAPTILVTGGELTLRDCIINESTIGDQACLKVEGGTVDAGTSLLPGGNKFVVNGAGSAIDNIPLVTLSAIGNDWGNPTGPTIASNPNGIGFSIVGAGKDSVEYDPFGGGPITTASTVTICAEATTVDIPIKASQLGNVGSFSLTLGFTPVQLTAPIVVSRNAAFDVVGHVWPDFEVTSDSAMLANGVYRISGRGDDASDGVSLANDEVLFTLRFNIGTIANTAALTFNEDVQGTACEFTGVAPTYVPYGDMPTATSYFDGGVIINSLSPNTIADAQTICYNTIPNLLTGSTVIGGTITYQWQSSTDGSSFADLSVGTYSSTSYQPSVLTTSTWYQRIATSVLNGVSCSTTSDAIKITVLNNFTPGAILTTNETICYNGDPVEIGNDVVASGGNESITYKWESSLDGFATAGSVISGATSSSYDPPTGLQATTSYRRYAHDATCNTSFEVSTGTWTVTVYDQFTTGEIATTGEAICYGGIPSTEIGSTTDASGGHGTITYEWRSSADAYATAISGATSATYTPSTSLTATTSYRRYAYDATCNTTATVSTGTWTVTVYDQFSTGEIATTGETICYGATPATEIGSTTDASGGHGTITYEWRSSADAYATAISGATSETYTPPAGLIATTSYQRYAHDAFCNLSFELSAGTYTVTVYNQFTTGAIATTGEAICYGGTPSTEIGSITDASGGHGTITYEWRSSADAYATAIIGATSTTYTPSVSLTTTTSYRRYAYDATCNTTAVVSTGTWTVTVYDQFSTGEIATTGETICYGATPATEIGSTTDASGGHGTITYEWRSSADAYATAISGATSASYTPSTSLTATTSYRRYAYDATCNTTAVVSTGTWVVTVNQLQKISGTFNYNNVANTPLTHLIHVVLQKQSDHSFVAQMDVNSGTGAYEFTNLCPDTYEIVATSTHPTAGSVNTTDAGQVNAWGVSPYAIENGRFYAGDVKGNNYFLNSLDAQRIQQNFVNGTAFESSSNWIFWKVGEATIDANTNIAQSIPTITLANSDVVQNMYGLCMGDFNRSFNPSLAKSASSTLNLIYAGNKQISNNQEFDLPLHIVDANSVGAISLILNFPANLVEVQDILLSATNEQLDWSVNGNELRIGWNSQTPLNLANAAEMITLKLKTTAAFVVGENIQLTLASNPLNELADAQFNVINNAVLSVDIVNASAVGISEQSNLNTIMLSNRPNPFNGTTTIDYELPYDGKVSLNIYNYLGSCVKTMVSEQQLKGNHSLKFEAGSLPAGVYMATLIVKSENNEMVRTIKLICNH